MIPSPKVATYDKQPEMSARGVAEKVAEILAGDQDFVMCNFAPPDMVSLLRSRSNFWSFILFLQGWSYWCL